MNGLNGFILGGYDSRDFGLIMTAPPPDVIAERDVESISVAGRSGDLTLDNGRYKNVTVEYECAILPDDNQTLRDAVAGVAVLLRPTAAYQRLRDTYHPDSFRMARVGSGISVESIVEQTGRFVIRFDCKPQRFLLSGENRQSFTAAGTLCNPTAFTAKPLITIFGASAGTVTVGSVTVEILDMEGSLILDCEIVDAYNADYANANSNIYAPEFPELVPGENPIRWTGGITKVEIIPRWWTL